MVERLAADARRLKSIGEAQEVRAARILKELSSFPEKDHADATRSDLRDGARASERAETTEAAPGLGEQFANGEVTGAHVDIVGDALRELEPAMRQKLLAHMAELTVAAKTMTPGAFRKHVQALVRRIQGDDGMSRFERQHVRRGCGCGSTTHGMGRLVGEFDPVTFAMLQRRLHDALGTLFARVDAGVVSQ